MEVGHEGADTGEVVRAVRGQASALARYCLCGDLISFREEVEMPQLGTIQCSPTREDFAVVLVADDDVNVREVNREACITDWPNANECLFKSRHDVPSTWEVSWEVGDTMLGRCAGLLALA